MLYRWLTYAMLRTKAMRGGQLAGLLLLVVSVPMFAGEQAEALDLQPQKTQEKASLGETRSFALDQNNWRTPQSIFSWIAMARGYETPWDSVGRQGWLTQDAYVRPVDPGVSTFTPDTPAVYIVFEIPPLDAPGQWDAAWFFMPDGKTPEAEPVGTDAQRMDWNEKYGYFELYQPEQGWREGKYLVKMYFGSPGQKIHDINTVGTMEFTISQQADGKDVVAN